ncbi:MAG: SpoIVB peptidase [Clostridia bacterium]|nr:SpoIVB peptidase [Clostridia bacterium]
MHLSLKKVIVVGFFLLGLIGCFTSSVSSLYSLPLEQRCIAGSPGPVLPHVPLGVKTYISGPNHGLEVGPSLPPGQVNVSYRLIGLIPLRSTVIKIVPPLELVPGGQSIGVMLQTRGIVVVGFAPVTTVGGRQYSPAKEAGLEIGDQIQTVGGHQVTNSEQAARLVDELGKRRERIEITFKRGSRQLSTMVEPAKCKASGKYRLGLFIRDGTAGVGTLTFYDPHSHIYGALGHLVADPETNQSVELAKGKIVEAVIQTIQKSTSNQPGEKVGVFLEKGSVRGNILKNTKYGIFGELERPPANGVYHTPIPVALASQVQEGPAEILTVVKGNQVERFAVHVEKVMADRKREGKGMVIRITDPKLIKVAGGIVQGMSGSPIIQNGCLVGAVTHVFINNPCRGYGVFIEWMLHESGFWWEFHRRQEPTSADAA